MFQGTGCVKTYVTSRWELGPLGPRFENRGHPARFIQVLDEMEDPAELFTANLRLVDLLVPLLIVEQFDTFSPGKPGSRWSPSFHNRCRAQ